MFHPKKHSSWQYHRCFIPKSTPVGNTTEVQLEGTARVSHYFSQACHMVNHSFQTPRSPTQLHGRETADTPLSLRLCCKTLTSSQVQHAPAAGHQPVPATVQCHACRFALLWDPTLLWGKEKGDVRVSWKARQELWSIFETHQPSPHKPQKLSHATTSQVPTSLCNQV